MRMTKVSKDKAVERARVMSACKRWLQPEVLLPGRDRRQDMAWAISVKLQIPMPSEKQDQWQLLKLIAQGIAPLGVDGPTQSTPPRERLVRKDRSPKITTKTHVVSAKSDQFLQSYEWRKLRMVVLTKRGNKCECCGADPKKDGIVINVDHIKPRRKYPELALSEDNLQVLCDVCNHGKGNWDETDWR